MHLICRCKFARTIAIAAIIIAGGGASPSTQTSDPAMLQTAWTVSRVRAALAWREEKLRNCSFAFSEESDVVKDGNPKLSPVRAYKVFVKYRDGAVWTELNAKIRAMPDLDVEKQLQTWDGSQSKSRSMKKLSATKAEVDATINQTEPSLFSQIRFFSVLGLRLAGVGRPWSKIIEDSVASGAKPTITVDGDVGNRRVSLVYTAVGYSPPNRFRFVFLPDKDFVAEEFDLQGVPGSEKQPVVSESWHVRRFEQFEGFWLPVDVLVNDRVGETYNTRTCELKSFSSAQPAQAEMQIDFPAGTRVMDMINLQYYQLLPDGKRRYSQFYDLDTGKIVKPTTQPATGP